MITIFYGILASLSAVTIETYYRSNIGKPFYQLYWTIPLIILLQFGIYGMLQKETILGMAIIFTFMMTFLRIIVTFWLGDYISPGTWAGFILTSMAVVLKVFWK